jgi:hypothetical protein
MSFGVLHVRALAPSTGATGSTSQLAVSMAAAQAQHKHATALLQRLAALAHKLCVEMKVAVTLLDEMLPADLATLEATRQLKKGDGICVLGIHVGPPGSPCQRIGLRLKRISMRAGASTSDVNAGLDGLGEFFEYETLVTTLVHELAHCYHKEHGAAFDESCRQLTLRLAQHRASGINGLYPIHDGQVWRPGGVGVDAYGKITSAATGAPLSPTQQQLDDQRRRSAWAEESRREAVAEARRREAAVEALHREAAFKTRCREAAVEARRLATTAEASRLEAEAEAQSRKQAEQQAAAALADTGRFPAKHAADEEEEEIAARARPRLAKRDAIAAAATELPRPHRRAHSRAAPSAPLDLQEGAGVAPPGPPAAGKGGFSPACALTVAALALAATGGALIAFIRSGR